MRGFPSDERGSISPAQPLFQLDAPDDPGALAGLDVLGRLALLIVVAIGFAAAAQLLVKVSL